MEVLFLPSAITSHDPQEGISFI